MNTASALFTPVNVGGLSLKNRLVALPVYTGYAHPGGRVSALLLDHYNRLACSGVAMVVVANAAVSADGILSDHNLRIDHDEFIPGLAKLAASIKSGGALACLQLNHGGRFSKTAKPLLPAAMNKSNLAFNVVSLKDFMNFFPFEKRAGLTRRFMSMAGSWSQAMSDAERRNTIAAFAKAAERACQAGFDMIELHGAGGYLICQFLSSFSNNDADKHAAANGQTFLLELIHKIKQTIPAEFPIGYRLITREWVPDGIDLPQALDLAAILESRGIAYLSASVGTYNSMFSPVARKQMDLPGYLKADVAALTRITRLPTIISGRITTPELANQLIAAGDCRLIGLGRVLRADPGWVAKAAQPAPKIKACINCNWCLKRVVLDEGFNCKLWSGHLQEKTDLSCKLLGRNYRGLLVAANPADVARIQAALPHLLPPRDAVKTSICPVLFLLQPDPDGQKEKGMIPQIKSDQKQMKQAEMEFAAVSRKILDQMGFEDSRIDIIERICQKPLDQEIQRQAQSGNNGLIIIPRNESEAWRDKVAYTARRKIVIMLGDDTRMSKILIPVDMSLSSLLVLMFLQQTFGRREKLAFHYVHVLSGAAKIIEQRWIKMKRLVGLKKDTPLQLRPAEGNVAETLVDIFKTEGYDTIIMGRRGISRIKYLVMGSVSAGILRRLPRETIMLVD